MADLVRTGPSCCTDAELLAQGDALRARAAASGADAPHEVIDGDGQPFRDAFNAGVGTVRVVMLVSPTCGYCLEGARSVHQALTASLADAATDVAVHVAWVPVLQAEAAHVPLATRFVSGAHVTHYWDAARLLVRGYEGTLGLAGDAWDVYLLYGPDARWEDASPPSPAFWMHQLGTRDAPNAAAPFLDAAAFADRAAVILGEPHASTRVAAHGTESRTQR
jgi:hypothetical protein